MDDYLIAGSEYHRLMEFQITAFELYNFCKKKYIKNYTNVVMSAIDTCDFLVDGDKIRRAFTISEALELIPISKEVKNGKARGKNCFDNK
jgi:hypothetical protein